MFQLISCVGLYHLLHIDVSPIILTFLSRLIGFAHTYMNVLNFHLEYIHDPPRYDAALENVSIQTYQ